MAKINVGIVGWGNLGKGAAVALGETADMELCGIFTRRAPEQLKTGLSVPVYGIDQAARLKGSIDVMLLCGGSATDLPEQGPAFAKDFSTVDSFDTHAKIPEYFDALDAACKAGGTVGILSVGWDPGLFSINRLYGSAILPQGKTDTFWGKGVSQGHSDAIRRVKGVKQAIQYTVPVAAAMDRVRAGEQPELSPREKHLRECYVVAEAGADLEQIENDIKAMPNYFEPYDTTVTFLDEESFQKDHGEMPHGGFVMHSARTGAGHGQMIEYALRLESNPEFTASVLVAYARAAYRLQREGACGAKTVFDIAPGHLSPKSPEALRKELL